MKCLSFVLFISFALPVLANDLEFSYQSKSSKDTNQYMPVGERAKKCMTESGKTQFTLHIRRYETTDGHRYRVAIPQCAQAQIRGLITCSYASIGDGRELSDLYGDCLKDGRHAQTLEFKPAGFVHSH